MKNFINREWEYPEYKYRAVDKNRDLLYYKEKPVANEDGGWWIMNYGEGFYSGVYTKKIKWKKSLETKKEYDKRDICLLCDNIIGKGKFCPKCMKEVGIKFCKMYKKSRMKSV